MPSTPSSETKITTAEPLRPALSLLAAPSIPDWERIRLRTKQNWAADIRSAIATDAAYWRDRISIPGPEADTAWTHFYFCDGDGARLVFDTGSPSEHRCSQCGRRYRDDHRNGAWRTQMHNLIAAQTQRYALLARTCEDQQETAGLVAEVAAIIDQYADSYPQYRRHGEHAGIGQVQPQSLDEAIWLITLLRSVRWVEELLPASTLAGAGRLAAQAVDLLRPQVSMIHNIHCWMLAALAESAVRLDDAELISFTRDSEYGVKAQLSKGFRAEGLWYEVNPHYHYYTVSALLSWYEAAGPDALDDHFGAILGRAVSAPPLLAYSDGLLPAYGDGWPEGKVGNHAAPAEAAAGLLAGAEIDLSPYYAQPIEQPVRIWMGGGDQHHGISAPLSGRASVAALIFGPDQIDAIDSTAPASFCWPGSGIALLRSADARITLRSGPDAGGHDHHDKLAVDVETATGWRSLDLGTSGYGAEFTNWLRSPAAHSTVFVGGRRQPSCDGSIVDFSEDHAAGSVSWPGCRMQRRIELIDDGWTDTFEVELDQADEIEWVFHGDGRIVTTADRQSTDLLGDQLGHDQLREQQQVNVDHGVVELSWDLPGSPTASISVPDGFAACTAVADGNPSGHPLGSVIIRGTAATATITARFQN
ncbi:MAG TPA: heparinase II/III family protein [Microlunatus sp.]